MAKTHEHARKRIHSRLIGLTHLGKNIIGLKSPTANRKFEPVVEEASIQPAIEDIQHRFGQGLRIGLRLPDDAAGILFAPAGDECGQQLLPIPEEPVETRARQTEFFRQRQDFHGIHAGFEKCLVGGLKPALLRSAPTGLVQCRFHDDFLANRSGRDKANVHSCRMHKHKCFIN
ncbi:hypothetical protein D3C87_1481700 [compost metagenome]